MNKILALFCFLLPLGMFGQIPDEATPMRVLHCTAVDQSSSVRNIYVDDSGVKWVATNKGVYQLYSADNSTKVNINAGNWALLRFRGGNYPLTVIKDELSNIFKGEESYLNSEDRVTAVFYNESKDELWVGTQLSGVYQINAGSLTLIQHFTTENSKLKSDAITNILVDRFNRVWIGTEKGVLYGNEGKWKLYEKNTRIDAITALGMDVWILTEGVLWKADEKNRWYPGDVDARASKGPIKDIEYDSEGRLWVASDVITRYDVVKNTVEIFDHTKGFKSSDVNYIKVDGEDALWIGTNDQGLYLIEMETKMTVTCAIEKGLSCEGGGNNASLKVKVIGGTAPYKYKWNNNYKGDNPQNLAAGIYTVKVTDATGQTREASAKIAGTNLTATATQSKKASDPDANDGVATVIANGGTPDYFYTWDNGEKGVMATKLTAGNHTVTIKDKLGCTTTATVSVEAKPKVEIEEPVAMNTAIPEEKEKEEEKMTATIIPPAPEVVEELTIDITKNGEIKCAGDKTVELTMKVNGGKKPYDIAWGNSLLELGGLEKVGAGKYAVTVTDAQGTTATNEIEIEGPSPIEVSVVEKIPVTRVGARDGMATASAKGGAGDFMFLWDNGESKAIAKKLSLKKHVVVATDANGCQAKGNIRMSEKQVPDLNVNNLRLGQIIKLEKLFFEADSTRITSISEPVLDELHKFLEDHKTVMIEVGGHTNNIPSHSFCDRLSTARAKAVADYLIIRGIESNRVQYKGYGKRKPIATNTTKGGRKKNQRVEIKIISSN